MIATILAAGKGSRLMPRTEYIPKTLVPVNGKPMFFYLLEALVKAGIEKVYVVVGYKKEVLKSIVGPKYKNLSIVYIDNDEYDTTNNIVSFALLEDYLANEEDDLFVLESDLVIDVNLLQRIKTLPKANYSIISPWGDWMDGTTADLADDGSIRNYLLREDQEKNGYTHINKYKTVNIHRLVMDDLKQIIFPEIRKYITEKGGNDYYEKVFQKVIGANEIKMMPYIVDQHSWYETDSDGDLNRAELLF